MNIIVKQERAKARFRRNLKAELRIWRIISEPSRQVEAYREKDHKHYQVVYLCQKRPTVLFGPIFGYIFLLKFG